MQESRRGRQVEIKVQLGRDSSKQAGSTARIMANGDLP